MEERLFRTHRCAKICEGLVLAGLFEWLAFEVGYFGDNLHSHVEKLRQEFCPDKRKRLGELRTDGTFRFLQTRIFWSEAGLIPDVAHWSRGAKK
jgi:hypothetical protein